MHCAGSADRQAGFDAFVRELGWREFAHHVLHHHPHTTGAPLDERFAGFEWDPDPQLLAAWQRGRTGFPIVDAGMQQLWTTGWMHNRVRMIVASLLTKNLRQHWLEGARWFWDTLVDADLASNTLGWQWVAGCGADAAPYFRVFNPLVQAARHDPDGAYVGRWLPTQDFPATGAGGGPAREPRRCAGRIFAPRSLGDPRLWHAASGIHLLRQRRWCREN